jgi:hypothetical protein
MQIQGRVVRRPFGTGTKSEHEGLMLETDGGTYRLRRVGGNPFHDPELDLLVGQQDHRTRGDHAGDGIPVLVGKIRGLNWHRGVSLIFFPSCEIYPNLHISVEIAIS